VRLRWWQEHHPAIDRLAARTRPPLELPMEAARSLVLAGDAVGFFTRTYVSEDLARGALAAVEVADMARLHRDAALVRRRRAGPLSPATAGLVEAVRAQAATLGLAQRRRHLPAPAKS
jgi:LysR family transcriptional regulator, low CO2-responsive transcriptional regulator